MIWWLQYWNNNGNSKNNDELMFNQVMVVNDIDDGDDNDN